MSKLYQNMIKQYQNKPTPVEAIQFTGEANNLREILKFCPAAMLNLKTGGLTIETLEGELNVSVNDWILKGMHGEFWPVKPHIFPDKYELIGGWSTEARLQAFLRWSRGEKFGVSTSIVDELTYGYGKLDELGFWEFPLPPDFIERINNIKSSE
jgi:hypothetical protein